MPACPASPSHLRRASGAPPVPFAVRAALFQNAQQAIERVLRRITAPKPSTPSGSGSESQFVLNDTDADVLSLVYAVEDCLFHGLKVRGLWVQRVRQGVAVALLGATQSVIPLPPCGCVHPQRSGDHAPHCWHFLETLARENNLAFGPTIVAIGFCTNLHTDRGLVCARLPPAFVSW